MLEQHAHAITQVLNHLVLQSVGLQPERVPEGGEAAAQQAEPGAPVEALPVCQEHLAVLQLGFPLLPPVGAQPPWHDQADQGGQPSGVPPTPPAGQEFGQSTAQDAQQNASTDHQAFGQRTSQGAQELTPSTPPAGAGEQGASGASHSTQGLSTAGSTPAGTGPGGSHGP